MACLQALEQQRQRRQAEEEAGRAAAAFKVRLVLRTLRDPHAVCERLLPGLVCCTVCCGQWASPMC